MLPEPVITLEGELWQGAWANGYTVRQLSARTPHPQSYIAVLEALYRGTSVLTQTVDLLDFYSKERFGIPLAARNGTSTIVWEVCLSDFYHNLMVTLAAQCPHVGTGGRAAPLASPLPQAVTFPPLVAEGAAPWLDGYIAHSATWSTRAADAYHAGVGLWMLSGVAAGRIAVELGSLDYPNLFLAMVSRSTLYAKTTTAKIGRNGLRQAGLGALLAPDRSTPQALMRSMAGTVPESYETMDDASQLACAARMAFAGQRTWYHEEWGAMLHQMARKDSPVSEFHGLLRQLDDGDSQYASETIARGLEDAKHPYLALLCSATPSDLAPFMRPGSPLWHDGFWPRFTFLTPLANETPSRRKQPVGLASLPAGLVRHLQTWHQSLGIPTAHIEEITKKGKGTGRYRSILRPVSPKILTISDSVLDAYYAYNNALLEMVERGDVASDLDSIYGRFHVKALRVAMLLASVDGHTTIALKHWAYAQTVVEGWRLMLHHLVDVASGEIPLTREELLEDKIERVLARLGPRTGRLLRHDIRGYASREIDGALAALVKHERIQVVPNGKTQVCALPSAVPRTEETDEEGTREEEVPF
jgi:hypothetical protein